MTSFATHLKTVNLKNTNIPSLLRSLVDSAPYVADGMFGPSEKSAVKSITEFYTKNPSIKPALEQILAYYDANMTSDHAFRGIAHRNSLSVDATSVKKFLADLNQDGDATDNTTDKKHRGDTAWIKEGTLENSLN